MPCAACEGLTATYQVRGLAHVRERFGCELWWRSDEAEEEAQFFATIYFTTLRPGRAGDLLAKPVWLLEVAEIGDLVQAEAEREIYDSMPKHKVR